jgi:hypothetical protein
MTMTIKKMGLISAVALASFLFSESVMAAGSISGKATFVFPGGKKPGRKKIQMAADPVCASKHTEPALSEVVVVDDAGGLQNVFVHLSKGVKGTFAMPDGPATLDQRGCVYVPHVLGVRAGQDIVVLNSDGTLHNIHPKPSVNDEFNLAMPKFLKKKTVSFAKAETMVPVKCDVHPWMQSYVGVLDHPFFSVSAENGSFTLKDVPAGTYTVQAWHERLGSLTQEVTVKDGEAAAASFSFAIPSK